MLTEINVAKKGEKMIRLHAGTKFAGFTTENLDIIGHHADKATYPIKGDKAVKVAWLTDFYAGILPNNPPLTETTKALQPVASGDQVTAAEHIVVDMLKSMARTADKEESTINADAGKLAIAILAMIREHWQHSQGNYGRSAIRKRIFELHGKAKGEIPQSLRLRVDRGITAAILSFDGYGPVTKESGSWQVNSEGKPVLDENGQKVPTYVPVLDDKGYPTFTKNSRFPCSLDESGNLHGSFCLARPMVQTVQRDAAGKDIAKSIKNLDLTVCPLTVREASAIHAKAHPGEGRKAQAQTAATSDTKADNLKAAIEMVQSALTSGEKIAAEPWGEVEAMVRYFLDLQFANDQGAVDWRAVVTWYNKADGTAEPVKVAAVAGN